MNMNNKRHTERYKDTVCFQNHMERILATYHEVWTLSDVCQVSEYNDGYFVLQVSNSLVNCDAFQTLSEIVKENSLYKLMDRCWKD